MIYLDFETRSEADIRETGAWVYSLHPSTSILCLAFKNTENGDRLLLKSGFEKDSFLKAYFNRYIGVALFESHNAFFEKAIWENILVKRFGWPSIPQEHWRCSASVAAYHALPRNLQNAGNILGLSQVKDFDGKSIMLQLAKPKAKGGFILESDAPEKFQKLYEYCEQDVVAEEALSERLGHLPSKELDIWLLDQKISVVAARTLSKGMDVRRTHDMHGERVSVDHQQHDVEPPPRTTEQEDKEGSSTATGREGGTVR